MPLNTEQAALLKLRLHERDVCNARKHLLDFTQLVFPKFQKTDFHENYYNVLHAFAKGRIKKLMISCPPQHGKQLSVNELVMTTEGIKKHGDLEFGDYVFSPSGKAIEVINNIHQSESCDMEITFSNGVKMKCHRNHEWGVYKRDKYKILEANHFLTNKLNSGIAGKRGSKYNYKLPLIESLDFIERETTIHPYLLGAWLGDGKSYSFTLTLNKEDYVFISKSISDDFSIHKESLTTQNINILGSLDRLRGYELLNNKHVPLDFKLNSIENRLELIAGMIDTDGSLHKPSGQYRFSNVNKRLIDDFCDIIKSLGFTYSLSKIEPRSEPNSYGIQDIQVCYQVGFTPTMKIPCRLKRKQSNKLVNKRRVSIVSARMLLESEKEQGNCITVDSEDGMYLAGKDLIPTHNSLGSTEMLPAYLLGQNPDIKIAIATYSDTFAKKFNRGLQRLIDSKDYNEIFPDTILNESNVVTVSDNYLRNASEFEIVGHTGSLKAIGKGGALTGNPVDVMIMDDLYKDYMEGNSPVVRENVWEWYTTVVKTRLHNDSQELIVFTRWNEDDLIGRLEKTEQVIEINSLDDIDNIPQRAWVKLNYEAIKTTERTELDNRGKGEPLFPSRHNLISLAEKKALDPEKFNCLYQGDPQSQEGLLYSPFKNYKQLPSVIHYKNCTDTADKGTDFLCSVNYALPLDNLDDNIYVTGILFTDEGAAETEQKTADLLNSQNIRDAVFESNSGGEAYARNVQKLTKCQIDPQFQSTNKESRIISNASTVNKRIVFPERWSIDWPEFYDHVIRFKKMFKANKHDDGADVLTMIIEQETNSFDDLYVTWQ